MPVQDGSLEVGRGLVGPVEPSSRKGVSARWCRYIPQLLEGIRKRAIRGQQKALLHTLSVSALNARRTLACKSATLKGGNSYVSTLVCPPTQTVTHLE